VNASNIVPAIVLYCTRMQAGDASGTGLLDLESRSFDRALINNIDPSWYVLLPPILGATDAVGTLRRALADELGLPAGVLVAPGSGDNMMSALGAGCVATGDIVVSLGTSGTVFGPSDTPVVDPSGLVAPFCDATGAPLAVRARPRLPAQRQGHLLLAHDLAHFILTASCVP
jgi:xylulokinase